MTGLLPARAWMRHDETGEVRHVLAAAQPGLGSGWTRITARQAAAEQQTSTAGPRRQRTRTRTTDPREPQ